MITAACHRAARAVWGHRAAGGTYMDAHMLREFFTVYTLYRWHGRLYAFRAAWRIAVQGLPF